MPNSNLPWRRRSPQEEGSPNRFIGKSPNPANGDYPWSLGKAVGRQGHPVRRPLETFSGPEVTKHMIMAPSKATRFGEPREERVLDSWNSSIFDERWINQSEDMYETSARRKSILTVSPDETPPACRSPGVAENKMRCETRRTPQRDSTEISQRGDSITQAQTQIDRSSYLSDFGEHEKQSLSSPSDTSGHSQRFLEPTIIKNTDSGSISLTTMDDHSQ